MAEQKSVAIKEKNITDQVLNRVRVMEEKKEIAFPPTYSYENALKSAWLILQDVQDRNKQPALSVCTQQSIANSLLNMVVQGLSPVKKQCYFIVYGKTLTLQKSYFGAVAAAKRLSGVKDVIANVIYEGDEFNYEFDFETGHKKITKHEQSFENIDITKIKGAYAIVITDDDEPNYLEIMNMKQIEQAWAQRKGDSKSDTHVKFTDQMAMKTVISRAVKHFVNTSDDSDILVGALNEPEEYEAKLQLESQPNSVEIDPDDYVIHDAQDAEFEDQPTDESQAVNMAKQTTIEDLGDLE